MTDLRAYWASENRALLVAVLVVAAVGLAMILGPVASSRRALLEEQAARAATYARWQEDLRTYRPITAHERTRWRALYDRLLVWLPVATDEPATMAAVARELEVPSMRDFQVQAGESLEGRGLAISEEMVARSVLDPRVAPVRAVPLVIAFKCSLGDLRTILAQLQAKEIPVLANAVRIRRLFGELDVRVDLVMLARGETS